jgi:hypothetical protein
MKRKYFIMFLLGFIVATIIMGATEPLRHDDNIIFVPVVPIPTMPTY